MRHIEGRTKRARPDYDQSTFEQELAMRLLESDGPDVTLRTPEAAAQFMSVAVWIIEQNLLEPDGSPARARTSLHSIYSLWRGWCADHAEDVQDKAWQSGVNARAHYDAHLAMQEVVL